ncbi:hypothetical protein HOE22_06005 [Candidatus Woesearchaeota archaeon]|jgi:hypothetical protein|nr:hypothetical protein [Candidatus Woesearchaeota archaeon]MBT5528498.1 hypothetical protein [Cytophagia bacterium]MBT5991925.1 hypothetical protein [Bacteroidota bacterium]
MGFFDAILYDYANVINCIHCKNKISFKRRSDIAGSADLDGKKCSHCGRFWVIHTYSDCGCENCTDIRYPNKRFYNKLCERFPFPYPKGVSRIPQHLHFSNTSGFNSNKDMVENFIQNFPNPLSLLTSYDINGRYWGYYYGTDYSSNLNPHRILNQLMDLGCPEVIDEKGIVIRGIGDNVIKDFIQSEGLDEHQIVFEYICKVKNYI